MSSRKESPPPSDPTVTGSGKQSSSAKGGEGGLEGRHGEWEGGRGVVEGRGESVAAVGRGGRVDGGDR